MRASQVVKQPPAFTPFEPITRGNISERIADAAAALGLAPEILQELFQAPAAEHNEAINNLRNHFFDENICNAGNDALFLDNLKQNIAVNMQDLAWYLFNCYPQKCIELRDKFNELFNSIAELTKENELKLSDGLKQACANRSLSELQDMLTRLYFNDLINQITIVRPTLRLNTINTHYKSSLITNINNEVQFTEALKQREERKHQAIEKAAEIARELARLKTAPRQRATDHADTHESPQAVKVIEENNGNNSNNDATASSQLSTNINSADEQQHDAAIHEPVKKRKFWQSHTFKQVVTGLGLFTGICLLGAGIAFSGGALGIGLIFAGLAVAGAAALYSILSNEKPMPISMPLAGFSTQWLYRKMPTSSTKGLRKEPPVLEQVLTEEQDSETTMQAGHSNMQQEPSSREDQRIVLK